MVSPEEVREAIKVVEDPEIGLSIIDLGLVYDCEVTDSNVKVTMSNLPVPVLSECDTLFFDSA